MPTSVSGINLTEEHPLIGICETEMTLEGLNYEKNIKRNC